MKKIIYLLLAFAMMAMHAPEARAELINLQFRDGDGSSYSGAAVIGSTGDTWNQLTSDIGTAISLNDSSNADTAATVDWSGSVWYIGQPGMNAGGFVGTEYESLMQSQLYTYGQKTISFSNLTPESAYDLYIYTQDSPDYGWSSLSVTVNGKTTTTIENNGSSDTFTENLNYLHLKANTDVSGSLTIGYDSGGPVTDPINPGGVINGIQLQASAPTPEPAMMLLMGIGGLAGALSRRKKQASSTES